MKLEEKEWINVWAGTWSLLSCTCFADQYTKEVKIKGRVPFPETIIFINAGKSECWIPVNVRDELGHFLVKEYGKSKESIEGLCDGLRRRVDDFIEFARKVERETPTFEIFRDMWKKIELYYGNHIAVKYIVDYLGKEKLALYLHDLESARVYAEPVFKISEDITKKLIAYLSGLTSYPENLLGCLTKGELETYFKENLLPPRDALLARFSFSALAADETDQKLFTGSEAEALFRKVAAIERVSEVRGTMAYRGIVRGIVRYVPDPSKCDVFNDGDILLSGMTRPEYLPLMKKAAAFITDGGGILCHAAIVARELKKPCIIGTKIATKVLKDGDLVEVDADKGVVTILKKS